MRAKLFRFLIIGGVSTAFHYAILAFCVRYLGMAPVLASSIGFSCSALGNYLLNRSYTFQSSRAHPQALPRFVITALCGLGWNALLLALFVHYGLVVWLAQALATLAVLGWNFLINALWTFGPARPSTND